MLITHERNMDDQVRQLTNCMDHLTRVTENFRLGSAAKANTLAI